MRGYMDLSQSEMAAKLGTSRKTLSQWESRETWGLPTFKKAVDLYVKVTGFPRAYFLVPDLREAFELGADGRVAAISAAQDVLARLEREFEARS